MWQSWTAVSALLGLNSTAQPQNPKGHSPLTNTQQKRVIDILYSTAPHHKCGSCVCGQHRHTLTACGDGVLLINTIFWINEAGLPSIELINSLQAYRVELLRNSQDYLWQICLRHSLQEVLLWRTKTKMCYHVWLDLYHRKSYEMWLVKTYRISSKFEIYIDVKFTVSILVYTSWFIKQQGCAAHLG